MTKSEKIREKLRERKDSVLLLRFRTLEPSKGALKYCSYARIAKIVCLTYNQVQHICKRALVNAGKRPKKQDLSRRLEQIHIDFLTSSKTLELWSGKTISERCILFHRNFPNKKIAPTSLRRFYLQHKIKRKKVRQEKYLPGHLKENYN